MRFPFDGAYVLIWSAIAIVAILRADAVAILGDFSCDPVSLRERPNNVANQLRLADAAGVAADYKHAPFGSCVQFTFLPAWLPAL